MDIETLADEVAKHFKAHYKSGFSTTEGLLDTEKNILSFIMTLGQKIEQRLFDEMDKGYSGREIKINNNAHTFIDYMERSIHGLFGKIIAKRAYYFNQESKGNNHIPVDKKIGIENGYTPGCQYFLTLHTAKETFQEGLNDFHAIFRPHGIDHISLKKAEEITYEVGNVIELLRQYEVKQIKENPHFQLAKELPVRDVMVMSVDGTGVRHKVNEKIDENDKMTYETTCKEAKIASISGVRYDEEKKEAHCINTTYTGVFGSPDELFDRLYVEMQRRAYDMEKIKLVFIADGARWILDRAKTVAGTCDCVEILDFYHASEHLHEVTDACYGENSEASRKKHSDWSKLMYDGKIQEILEEIKLMTTQFHKVVKTIESNYNYFEERKDRMRYDEYRAMKLPIASGTVESACKNVVGARMKQTGMIWTEASAKSMLQIRCSLKSKRLFEEYSMAKIKTDVMEEYLSKAA